MPPREQRLHRPASRPIRPIADPRAVRLLEEACRHGKAITIADTARAQFDNVSFSTDTADVIFGDATASTEGVLGLLPAHRIWDRLGSVQAG
ncbi:hypothetical protein E3T61_09960 [Cryobacterium lactosi]|uniref:Large catalase C-terminal domain-containing protein n=1 Tax=Cryobacterium lactosi TaxID=1259202 RepID=A0A4R9BTS8_9MICO|nr:hypothetical protein E3T61_09960 [Cryobacterium lactosi]